ncbi:MAG: hypothetical protein DRQ39_04365 [Gammaproteobacteria bacterium]|nr:MAG: hypothetical protein DRQ39_04365 [Gammaproteobacteria bacterium]
MNPCNVCGERTLIYPGTCDPCKLHAKMLYQTQWQASYKANTARHEAQQISMPDIDPIGRADELDARAKNRKNRKVR